MRGEPSKLTLPYGAYFRYLYQTGTFLNGVQRREVVGRVLSASANGVAPVEKLEVFTHPDWGKGGKGKWERWERGLGKGGKGMERDGKGTA